MLCISGILLAVGRLPVGVAPTAAAAPAGRPVWRRAGARMQLRGRVRVSQLHLDRLCFVASSSVLESVMVASRWSLRKVCMRSDVLTSLCVAAA